MDFFVFVAILFTQGYEICQRAFALEPEETLVPEVTTGATLGTVADASSTTAGAATTAGIAATTLVAGGVRLASNAASLRKDPRMWVS